MTKIKVNLLIIFAALSMQSCSAKSQAGYYKGYELFFMLSYFRLI